MLMKGGAGKPAAVSKIEVKQLQNEGNRMRKNSNIRVEETKKANGKKIRVTLERLGKRARWVME